MAMGAKLNELRKKKGESLQQTANAVGTTKGHLWQIERGKAEKPAISLVSALADHFGVSVAYLVGEDIDAGDDTELAGMFRQAQSFDDNEREILRSLMETLSKSARRRKEQG